MRFIAAILPLILAAPAMAQEVLPWSDPRAAQIWPEHVGMGNNLKVLVFKNDRIELQVLHGFAICGNRGRCPGRMIENGVVWGKSECARTARPMSCRIAFSWPAASSIIWRLGTKGS